MSKDKHNVIGLMSGTSLDGLDLAHCTFEVREGKWIFRLNHGRSVPYDTEYGQWLQNLVNVSSSELLQADQEYGLWLGEHIKEYLDGLDLPVDFIASHGHTIFHQPQNRFTYQIGSGQVIANTCQLPVVNNFREKDVSLGGQGAPLVPVGDQILFSEYDYCLNLGGIANVSFENQNGRLSFDICPANMILNFLAQKMGRKFDHGGEIAKSGSLHEKTLQSLNSLSYYHEEFPKSLGYEWFEEQVLPILEGSVSSIEDLLFTAVEHIVEQIYHAISPFASANQSMLVTGGGAYNNYLFQTLQSRFKHRLKLIKPDDNIIAYKEAIIFGFLGVLRWRNEVNCLKSVTGASEDSSGGVIYLP